MPPSEQCWLISGPVSATDFEIDIQKKEDPKGDRAVVSYNGKILP